MFRMSIEGLNPQILKRGLGLLVLAITLSACEKADEWDRSPKANFEALWKIMD